MSLINQVIVALDNMDKKGALSFIKNNPEFSYYKVGIELFYAYGKDLVSEINEKYNKPIFLDLKLHDIPNTVAKAIKSLQGLNLKFLTIHLSGGKEMIEAAITSRNQYLPGCDILGVSYLTSLNSDDAKQLWGHEKLEIERLASVANETGIDGIVCSAQDLEKLSHINAYKVCPGIRFKDESSHDQKRVMDPHTAIEMGAKYLVMGRSLTQASDIQKRIKELTV